MIIPLVKVPFFGKNEKDLFFLSFLLVGYFMINTEGFDLCKTN